MTLNFVHLYIHELYITLWWLCKPWTLYLANLKQSKYLRRRTTAINESLTLFNNSCRPSVPNHMNRSFNRVIFMRCCQNALFRRTDHTKSTGSANASLMPTCGSGIRRDCCYHEDCRCHPGPRGVESKLAPLLTSGDTQFGRRKTKGSPHVEGHCQHPGEGRQEEVLSSHGYHATRFAACL